MFEVYLEDAHYLALEGQKRGSNEIEARRYYRAAVFHAASALEAFVNYIGNTIAQGGGHSAYEIAFLTDRKFGISDGRFEVLEQMEYHRLEDKLRFLICKFVPSFDLASNIAWSRCLEFKRFRDDLIHPRQDEDTVSGAEYLDQLKTGLSSIIEIIDCLCKGIFQRNLRKRIRDLQL